MLKPYHPNVALRKLKIRNIKRGLRVGPQSNMTDVLKGERKRKRPEHICNWKARHEDSEVSSVHQRETPQRG